MFEREYITMERSMLQDTVHVRWREIRAITGTVGGQPGGDPEIIEGSCTLYLEGELGFVVNHTAEEVIAMINERQVTQ